MMINKDDLFNYYILENHSINECCQYFNTGKSTLCRYINKFNIHKDKELVPKRKSTGRSHESYVEGGKKSAQTQKKNWELKDKEERAAWSQKMKDSHNTEYFKNTIREININYNKNLSEDKKQLLNKKRSNSCSNYWYNNFTEEERKEWIKTSLEHGAGWNYESACKTNIKKYGVPNQYMRTDLNYSHMNSGPNEAFYSLLLNNNFNANVINREFPINNRAYDFKINDTLIEINPFATHNSTWSPFNKPLPKNYHYEKSKLARDYNYKCIHIWDWDDLDKILKLLKEPNRLYARKCILKEVPIEEAKSFIDLNHLQGYTKDFIRLGLYYNDELVSIMTFGKPRYNKNYEYELLRYCSSYKIIGGAEKLFSHFIKDYNPKSIISYCDLSKFTGNTYLKLGFSLNRISIGRHWYNPKTKQHITDNLLRQRGFDQLFGTTYGKGTSNSDLMRQNGFVEIYDAGQATYVLKF